MLIILKARLSAEFLVSLLLVRCFSIFKAFNASRQVGVWLFLRRHFGKLLRRGINYFRKAGISIFFSESSLKRYRSIVYSSIVTKIILLDIFLINLLVRNFSKFFDSITHFDQNLVY
jgi:hypothetical protein